ncbi:unnamed protein product [Victoria cruziana]
MDTSFFDKCAIFCLQRIPCLRIAEQGLCENLPTLAKFVVLSHLPEQSSERNSVIHPLQSPSDFFRAAKSRNLSLPR